MVENLHMHRSTAKQVEPQPPLALHLVYFTLILAVASIFDLVLGCAGIPRGISWGGGPNRIFTWSEVINFHSND
ncbi:hypothetical protein TorRG33x02_205810 [Trema orientale]|uniref:Uncharacterized protein n=1 Tax=Trema orientale TaxID=63057 RepID=A0A2P5EDM4_TREOI|nr:hypothetical protein TorRG33x02_205810 [Trema orientale]